MKTLKLDPEEKEILEELEGEEWRSTITAPRDFEQFKEAARNTLKKDRRVNNQGHAVVGWKAARKIGNP